MAPGRRELPHFFLLELETRVWEHVATASGTPLTRFRRAIETRSILLAEIATREAVRLTLPTAAVLPVPLESEFLGEELEVEPRVEPELLGEKPSILLVDLERLGMPP
jgi:hypothetical protein